MLDCLWNFTFSLSAPNPTKQIDELIDFDDFLVYEFD